MVRIGGYPPRHWPTWARILAGPLYFAESFAVILFCALGFEDSIP